MRHIIHEMDKTFDSRVRIAIMSILMLHEWVDFNTMKERLGVTDGNLASHMATLEKREFIFVKKRFINKRPNTSYKATSLGKEHFIKYINALKELLNIKK